jgi:hypothetical protein
VSFSDFDGLEHFVVVEAESSTKPSLKPLPISGMIPCSGIVPAR